LKGSLPLSVSHIYPDLAAGPFTDRLARRAADYLSDALYPDKAYCRKNLRPDEMGSVRKRIKTSLTGQIFGVDTTEGGA
jgi:hypothetical protein